MPARSHGFSCTKEYSAWHEMREGHPEETRACYERIEELKASLAEMVSIYWGEGDGIYPPPACIIRAELALAEEVLS